MLPIATAMSHLAVKTYEVSMLTTIQIILQTMDLAIDLFLDSLMFCSLLGIY